MPNASCIHQAMWLGLSAETWAIVLATFAGPVAAIVVNRWRDLQRETRSRRLAIFRTLMTTRRTAITQEHVGAVNLVEVEFHGVKAIETSWKAYSAHLNSRDGPLRKAEERQRFEEKRVDLLAALIFSISRYLGFKMSELDIRNGGYAPDGWRYRDERLGTILDYVRDIAMNKAYVPVGKAEISDPSPSGDPR